MTYKHIDDPQWTWNGMHACPEGYELLDYIDWGQWNPKQCRQYYPELWARNPKYWRRKKFVIDRARFKSIQGEGVTVSGHLIPEGLFDFCRLNAFPYLRGYYIPVSWTDERLKGTPYEGQFIY